MVLEMDYLKNGQLRYEWNYKDGKEHVASVGYSIGDFAQGGVIFWLDETKKHGLVCPIEDQGSAAWLNTHDIVSDSMNHSFYGKRFRDWRVPTKSELNRMYKNKVNIDATAVLNGGSTFVNNYYWSSSESWGDDGTYFLGQWGQSFKDGYQDDDYYKWVKFNVRAVRNF